MMCKKIFGAILISALCFGFSACGNYSGSSDREATTPGTSITTMVATVTTTTSSSSEDVSTTTEPIATSDADSEVSTTTTTAKTSTVASTTTKVTTTKKSSSVVTTTTKKKATTTNTTTKKKTTTTTTTPKPTTTPEVTTTTTAFVPLITQDEIDKLVVELQKYSNSKTQMFEIYEGFDEYIIEEYGSIEAYYDYRVETLTPDNSSWGAPTTINPEIHDYKTAYDMMIKFIDFIYNDVPDCHIVIYDKYYPNEITGNESSYSWEIYRLH